MRGGWNLTVQYNSNNGWFRDDNSVESELAQAFTHFTYVISDKQQMVCDIQGVKTQFTDPQIHSVDCEFGRGDLGEKGFSKFMETHECNSICKHLL